MTNVRMTHTELMSFESYQLWLVFAQSALAGAAANPQISRDGADSVAVFASAAADSMVGQARARLGRSEAPCRN